MHRTVELWNPDLRVAPRSSDSRVSEVFTTDIDGAKQPDDRLRRSRSAQPTSRMNIENRQVCDLGAAAVLVKGGQLPGQDAVDLFYDGAEFVRLAATRIDTPHTHGTGCTYSAAITAFLARGETLTDAVHLAKDFFARAIASAPGLGHGHGPVDHWA
jgi:hydroxymethylpyrimidine kinase/phosphomethylpyrimidine kinase